MYRTGLVPRQENVPLTIDAQYVVGFNWERQATLRVVKDFDDHKIWAGFSIEEPQTLFSSSRQLPDGCHSPDRDRRRHAGKHPVRGLERQFHPGCTATTSRRTSSSRSRLIRAGATTNLWVCSASWTAAYRLPRPEPARTQKPRARASAAA